MRMGDTDGETALELIERLGRRRARRRHLPLRRRAPVAPHRALHPAGATELASSETTLDLRRAVVRAVGPARVGGVDPATRTFQALRIAVNRELDELEGAARDRAAGARCRRRRWPSSRFIRSRIAW